MPWGAAQTRRGYLTAETDRVLFDRAGWFELAPDGWEPVRFTVPRTGGGGRFTVEIRWPRLVLFEWGSRQRADRDDPLATGFLVLEVGFPVGGDGAPELDDLLRFQDLFRYWRQPFEGHDEERGFSKTLGDCPERLLPPEKGPGESPPKEPYADRWKPLLDLPVEDCDGHRWALLWQGDPPARFPYADPRAFVWTCALLKGGSAALSERFGSDGRPARHGGHWIKLLNVDPPGLTPNATAESTEFERAWVDERTYRRWEHAGSLYGFGYHGGAMLAPPVRVPPTWRHWSGHYFDQTLLLLYLRVTSFRFSGRLTEVTENARGDHGERAAWRREFGRLRRDFALFANLYEFPLVSNQQQGIEMYALAREHLDVAELFREVEKEIASTHEYFENESSQLQAQVTTILTLLATIGLPLALVTGFFGMNIVAADLAKGFRWGASGFFVLVTFLALFGVVVGVMSLMRARDRATDLLARLGRDGRGREDPRR